MKFILATICVSLIGICQSSIAEDRAVLVKSYTISKGTQEAEQLIAELNTRLGKGENEKLIAELNTGLGKGENEKLSPNGDILVKVREQQPVNSSSVKMVPEDNIRSYETVNCGPLNNYRLTWEYKYMTRSDDTPEWVLHRWAYNVLPDSCV
ncbi:hypothetical protein [Microbulbifer sp. ZKSA002]|uniref:hypothetical protein n=1 Tax=Microbulbifer sp. ZKSA002 TaxID=3243388 RepID=UPI004039D4AC